MQETVDAGVKKIDEKKAAWKKKHTPRVSGGDRIWTHLPRHPTLKTPMWAIDGSWWMALREGDRAYEAEYVLADDENSGNDQE